MSDPSPFAAFGDPSNPGKSFNAEGANARLAELQERMQQSMSATNDMAEQLGALSATGMDENGVAEATVDSQGGLVDLRYTDRAARYAPLFLARAALEANRVAKARLAERTREVIADTIGSDSEAGKAVLSSIGKRLGTETDGQDRA
ncbi:YbaB/EbfC family DNA-binding protein [Glycomyces buryatensis]|uniref:YbaB/EbfC family DNA-binding protein n=1 Tax=Glycomyces buryatensis TaxID=2570927 RepID=A0A4S8QCK9_9ACTN|nr:YbaB/EbfC family DNA-binding protein [Glycomyces buryatensis]THV42263.1 YbaB/EbfC family DNA-binding protein [Glycomyces buryatensis]